MSRLNRAMLSWLSVVFLLLVSCKSNQISTKIPDSENESMARRRFAPAVSSAGKVEAKNASPQWPERLELSHLAGVKIGMCMTQVFSLFGFGFGGDQPVRVFPAADGGYYVFSFFETNEVEAPEITNCPPLVAVAKVNTTEATSGTYVLPEKMAGLAFTGYALVDTRMAPFEQFTLLLQGLSDPHERVAIVAAKEIQARKDTNELAELLQAIRALPPERRWLGFRTLRSYPTTETEVFLMKSLEEAIASYGKKPFFDEKNALYIAESLRAVVVSLNGSEKGVPVSPAKRLREYLSTFLDQIRGAADSQ